MNLITFYDYLKNEQNLKIDSYGVPKIKSIFNYRGKSIYAQITYTNENVFRLWVKYNQGILQLDLCPLIEIVDEVLFEKLKQILNAPINQYNNIMKQLITKENT